MAPRLRVLVVASEASPFAKTGGLGDVTVALPRALRALGHDVRVLIPRYRGVDRHASEIRTVVPRLQVPVGDRLVEGALLATETSAGVPVYFLQQDHYFDRDGLYGTADGDYSDNCERFVFFCRGTLEALIALVGGGRLAWRPQIIHANDWQTGLISVYLRTLYRDHPAFTSVATVFTIHNLAYQGVFWHHDMPMTGLGWDVFTPAGLEFYGKLNFLKGGLVFSDLLTTVSRTYAAEIRTPEFGNGLEGVLEERAQDLHGVVNGIDYEQWNPAKDPALPRSYSAAEPEGKLVCREALRRELGLHEGRGRSSPWSRGSPGRRVSTWRSKACPACWTPGAGSRSSARARRPSRKPGSKRPRATRAQSPCASATIRSSPRGCTPGRTVF
jgi:starch synthase